MAIVWPMWFGWIVRDLGRRMIGKWVTRKFRGRGM